MPTRPARLAMMRARAEIITDGKDRETIVSEIPYQVNKAQLLERIGELVREKTIEGISDIRDDPTAQACASWSRCAVMPLAMWC